MAGFWNIVIAVFFFAHGFGHVQGLIAHLGFSTVPGHHFRSWLITPIIGDTVSRMLGFSLYAGCMILWVAAGLALNGWFISTEYFKLLATIAAIVSIVSIIIFWNSLMLPFNRFAALAFNLIVLGSIFFRMQ